MDAYDIAQVEMLKKHNDLLKEYRSYLSCERRLSDRTISSYSYFITKFLDFLSKDPTDVQTHDIKDFLQFMENKGNCNGSVSNYISALRAFYVWLSYINQLEKLAPISFFLSKVVRTRQDITATEVPTAGELERLRVVLQAYKHAASFNKKQPFYAMVLRDTAIIEMLVSTGARSQELRSITKEDINLETNEVIIKKGKGNRQRVAIFSEKAQETLKEYITNVPMEKEDRVFVVTQGNMINTIIRKWAKAAGINCKIHAHSFRHYHITEAQRKGVPMQVVADQVGHANLNTTRHYTHFDVQHRRDKYKDCVL